MSNYRIFAYAANPANPYGYVAILDAQNGNNHTSVGLTADDARDLAAELTACAGEEEPAPEFKVGDRVKVTAINRYSRGAVGDVGTIRSVRRSGAPPARDGKSYGVCGDDGTYISAYGVEHYTPDYAAKAATFKPGDLAIVSDNPGTEAEPGSGFVEDDFNGKAVNVVSAEDDPYAESDHFGPECVRVALGNGDTNYVHAAHLTRVEAVKW